MKKYLFLVLLTMLSVTVSAQKASVVIPGKGKIDVEKLNRNINMKMDVSQLSLSELRVLRNAFAARQGYIFNSGELRSLFSRTSWYDQKMYDRWSSDFDGGKKMPPIKYSAAETAFISKLKAREDQLKKQNFKAAPGQKVNVENVVNPYQLEDFSGELKTMLAKNGFAIVQDSYDQLFQVYENNDYRDFPSFVTTDLYLQAFHVYFDALLRLAEESELSERVLDFSETMKQTMLQISANNPDPEIRQLAEWDAAYFAVAVALLTDKPVNGVQGDMLKMAEEEVKKVNDAELDYSEFLNYTNVPFTYNLFRPRGHYTRSELLGRYFRGMMWLQTVPFGTDKPEQMKRLALLAETMAADAALNSEYKRMMAPIDYLMGEIDNVSVLQVEEVMDKNGLTLKNIIADEAKMKTFVDEINKIDEKQTRIKPKFEMTSHVKVNLMPQRYMPDAEVLQEMVDAENNPTKRGVSKGLDYFAAMGWTSAERILLGELQEAQKWEGYKPNLERMKARMGEINWSSTVANYWVNSLTEMGKGDSSYPYFMNSEQWDKKNLNAALASWAELKHDAILYAKQPFMAECGDGGPEAPVVLGFVEPNVRFWKRAINLIDVTDKAFKQFEIENERIDEISNSMRENAEFFLAASEKELKGEKLTKEEYGQIEIIGSTFEYLTLKMLQQGDEELATWDYVEGADKKVALIADVLTANGANNPDKCVLYEALGPANTIYVVVEIDGLLYLTRGAVFSYRETFRPATDPRMTDEEWQENLESDPNEGIPSWMKEIIIEKKNVPEDNEKIFYSSGC